MGFFAPFADCDICRSVLPPPSPASDKNPSSYLQEVLTLTCIAMTTLLQRALSVPVFLWTMAFFLTAGLHPAFSQTPPVESLTASDNLETGVDLFWEIDSGDVDNGSIFEIRVEGELIGVAASNERSYTHEGDEFYSSLSYCVTHISASGISSTEVCDNGSREFFYPTNFQASDGSSEAGVQLTWSENSEIEAAYVIRRNNVDLVTVAANTSSYFDNTAETGVEYDYSILQ